MKSRTSPRRLRWGKTFTSRPPPISAAKLFSEPPPFDALKCASPTPLAMYGEMKKAGRNFTLMPGSEIERFVVLPGEKTGERTLIAESRQERNFQINACTGHADQTVRKIELITYRRIKVEIVGGWKLARGLYCEFVLLGEGIYSDEKDGDQQSGG